MIPAGDELRWLPRSRPARGFTLIETAVVLVVITLVLGSLLVPLVAQVEQRKIESTEKILEQAREALLAFAAARGRLPCPAQKNGGREEFKKIPPPPGTANTGECEDFWGFLPAATLGLSPLDAKAYARDGWGVEVLDNTKFDQNRIRYAVRDFTIDPANQHVFTKTNGIKMVVLTDPRKLSAFVDQQFLFVCNSGTGVSKTPPKCGDAVTLTEEAVAVIWASGPNAATGGVSVDEAENPNPNGGSADRVFVSRPRRMELDPGNPTEFDDQMVWITPPILFQRMIAAGQLP